MSGVVLIADVAGGVAHFFFFRRFVWTVQWRWFAWKEKII
jgi:hypothetical protein